MKTFLLILTVALILSAPVRNATANVLRASANIISTSDLK